MSLIEKHVLGLSTSLTFISDSLSELTTALVDYTAPKPRPPFSTIYAFGDSLSDAGNAYVATGGRAPVSPPYFQGHFSNGYTWVEDLAQAEGLGPLTPSLLGGNDFAVGDASTGTTPLHAAVPGDLYSQDPTSQLAMFQAAHPVPQPNALYTLTIGSVDVFDAISAFPTNPLKALQGLSAAVANVDHFITSLAADGGRNFLVLTVPDVGKTPAYESAGPVTSHLASAVAALFDTELTASLRVIAAQNRLNMDIVDTYSLIDQGIAHPALFGLTNVTDPVWTGNYTDPTSGVLQATPQQQSHYLFWDQVHPTAAGHMILAKAAEASLGQTV